ncbi:hypothetical protein SH2C18_26210 [Clostridium sediminicola]|uniref:hypothetical protein n=1 Tax=Clostridium sediminicola TaxID=3114879 RepID=UPI0031F25155
MINKRWNKSFKAIVSCLILVFIFALSGCGKKEPITLKQAMENSNKMKSGYYSANMAMNLPGDEESIPINAQVSFDGAFDIENEEKGKNEVNINLNMEDLGMDFQFPIVIDTKSANDADIFITIPTMFAQMMGLPEGKNVLYYNPKDIIKQDEKTKHDEFLNSLTKFNESINAIFDNFTKNNKGVLVFEEIEGKSIESNGKYLFNLNKEQSIKFMEALFADEEVISLIEQMMQISESANPSEQKDTVGIEGFKEEFFTGLQEVEEFNLEMETIINDGFITGVKYNVLITAEGQTMEMVFDYKIERINEAVEIKVPDKNDESVIKFSDLEKMQDELTVIQ